MTMSRACSAVAFASLLCALPGCARDPNARRPGSSERARDKAGSGADRDDANSDGGGETVADDERAGEGGAKPAGSGDKNNDAAGSGADGMSNPGDAPSGDGLPGSDGAGGSAADGGGSDGQGQGAAGEPSAPAQCEPQGGRYSVLEGESLTLSLSCLIAGAHPSSWSLDALPSGAEFDETTGTLSWRPGLDQAATYKLTVQAMPWAEATTVDIAVVDRWDADGNAPLVDPAQYLEEYGLPVLHLNTDPGLNDDEYTPATITYGGHTYTGSEAKHRGATSAGYPKRSFTLKFTKEDKFSDPNRAGGFLEKRKIVLITSFDDNSYVRQRLGYELWNRMDPAHIRVQSYNVVVYLNGEYHGLYTLADHIDGYLMEDFGHDQEGNLYKARTYDANFRRESGVNFDDAGVAQPKETLHDGFTKEEGTPEEGQPGDFDDLDALVAWAADSSDEEFARTIDTTIARKEYEDWWIWVSYIRADDSAGKNSYHYHDPLIADSVWHCVPWDLNASFGQDWRTMRSSADTSSPDEWFRYVNNLFHRILSDPNMGPRLEQRYGEELNGVLARDSVLALLDAMVAEVEESARRDEQRWDADFRSYQLWQERTDWTTFQEEAAYVREWIGIRYDFLDALY
jgi:spore coat protein H